MSRHLGVLLTELTEPFRPGFHMDGGCDDRESEIDEALEHIEQAETLVHRIATMIRTIADLKVRLDRSTPRVRQLEDALRKIAKHPHPGEMASDGPGFRSLNEMRGIAAEALEEEIPF